MMLGCWAFSRIRNALVVGSNPASGIPLRLFSKELDTSLQQDTFTRVSSSIAQP